MCAPGKVLCRGRADALFIHFIDDIAVTPGDGIAGVKHHLSGKLACIILSDLRIGAIGHGDENDVTERDRLGDGAGLGQVAKSLHQRRKFFGVTG